MSAWGTSRQITYIFILFVIVVAIVGFGVWRVLDKPKTCFDNIKNQNELDVDCGGPCARVCASETTSIVTKWTRVFPVKHGVFDAAAYIENHNLFGAVRVPYSMKTYDDQNLLVTERQGEVYLNPNEQFVVVESAIDTGERVPVRAFFEFSKNITWHRVPTYETPTFLIKNKTVSFADQPKVTATLINASLFDVKDVSVAVVVYDQSGNAVATSKTLIPGVFAKNTAKELVFTWPEKISGGPSYADIYPRADGITSLIQK